MNIAIVDYNSGNISSVINSFKIASKESKNINIEITSNLKVIINQINKQANYDGPPAFK